MPTQGEKLNQDGQEKSASIASKNVIFSLALFFQILLYFPFLFLPISNKQQQRKV